MLEHNDTPPPIPDASTASESSNIITTLLKAPQDVSAAIAEQRQLLPSSLLLLAVAMLCHALFGFAIGLFGGFNVAIMDAVKIPLVAICSLLLCFPSLYVFSCVTGSPLSLSQTLMLGCSCLAMVGLLLVGLAPVVWLFAVSTESLPFVAFLTLGVLFIALLFTVRFIGKLRSNPLFRQQTGISIWVLIITIVTLQMTTTMRPILGEGKAGWWTGEKKSFLLHFGSSLEE
jgi:hypothetical protein